MKVVTMSDLRDPNWLWSRILIFGIQPIFWIVAFGVYTFVGESVPKGAFGISRWWDVVIQPLWVGILYGLNSVVDWVPDLRGLFGPMIATAIIAVFPTMYYGVGSAPFWLLIAWSGTALYLYRITR